MKANILFQLLIVLFLVSCKENNSHTPSAISGEYQLVSSLAPHNLPSVELEVFINFNCAHCYISREVVDKLKNKYGNSLQIDIKPVVFKNQDDSAVRLYQIAKRANLHKQAIEALFEAKFEHSRDILLPTTVLEIARQLSLAEQYQLNRNADWVTKQVENDRALAKVYGLTQTPSWVIERQLNVKTDVNNLIHIIDNLLVK